MRICLWHGWLLAGTGSNVFAAKKAETLRAQGHDVLLLCQDPHPERYAFVDAWAAVDARGISDVVELEREQAPGRVVLLRPDIGSLLPVFVLDEYEGFDVKRFVDLTDAELARYLDVNADALRTAVEWHASEVTVAGHIIPGPVLARRSLGPRRYAVHVHGSDLEYAIEVQARYATLARPALEDAVAVLGSSDDVLTRATAVAPGIAGRTVRITPGVDVERFRTRPRSESLTEAADILDGEGTRGGRDASTDELVGRAVAARDGEALDALARSYDQRRADRESATRLRRLSGLRDPVVAYLGKLIPQKGVEVMIESLARSPGARGLVLGFGGAREWYAALVAALHRGDVEAARWLAEAGGLTLELDDADIRRAAGFAERVDFTGIVDHTVAPLALAAADVLVVPSVGREAFGMVAAEAAATGAMPLVARHSGLAEVAGQLERAVGRPGIFSFTPGPGAVERCRRGIEALLGLSEAERASVRRAIAAHVRREWTWERSVERMLAACVGDAEGAATPRG